MQHVAAVEDFDLAMWNKLLALNLTAAFLLTKHVLPSMRARGYGRVINVSSGTCACAHSTWPWSRRGSHLGLSHRRCMQYLQHCVLRGNVCVSRGRSWLWCLGYQAGVVASLVQFMA